MRRAKHSGMSQVRSATFFSRLPAAARIATRGRMVTRLGSDSQARQRRIQLQPEAAAQEGAKIEGRGLGAEEGENQGWEPQETDEGQARREGIAFPEELEGR